MNQNTVLLKKNIETTIIASKFADKNGPSFYIYTHLLATW